MVQKLKITRVGGMLPSLRPSAVVDVDQLDPQAQRELQGFIGAGSRLKAAPFPGAMAYVFELEDAASGASQGERSCMYEDIPETLRRLLPGPH